MRWPVRCAAALLFAAAAPACSDDSNLDDGSGSETGSTIEIDVVASDLAALVCEAQATCDCEPAEVAAECASAIKPALAGGIARGQVLGLRYHEDCLDLAAAHLAALGCRRSDEVPGDEGLAGVEFRAARCKPLSGADGVGDACQTVPGSFGPLYLGDSCAPELFCVDGSCARLVAEVGDVCAGAARCPPGSACVDPEASGVATCQPPSDDGEKCNPHDQSACDVDLVCSRDEAVCRPAPVPGEACPQGLCVTGSVCDGAICQMIPGEGETCSFFGCADGLACDPETVVCRPLPVAGEPCLNATCAPGGLCGLEGVCVDDPALLCKLPYCPYRFDGLCDEPEGTGLCADATDPEDCGEAV